MSNKTIKLVAGAAIVLAFAAFGSIRYIESRVVSEVRALVATAPPELKLTVDDIHYSFLTSKLTAKTLRCETVVADLPITYSVGEVIVENLNTAILDYTAKNATSVPLASSIIVNNYLAVIPDGEVKVKTLKSTNIAINMQSFNDHRAKSNTKQDLYLALMYTTTISEIVGDKFVSNLKTSDDTLENLTISMQRLVEKDIREGKIASARCENMVISQNAKSLLSIELFSMENFIAPPENVTRAILNMNTIPPTPEEQAELAEIIQTWTSGPTPVVARVEIHNIISRIPQLPFSLGSFVFTNPSNNPLTTSYEQKNLVFPVNISPELEELTMLGYNSLDISGLLALTWPQPDTSHTVADFSIADMAKTSLQVDLLTDSNPNLQLITQEQMQAYFDSLKIKNATFAIEDAGLLGRAAATAQLTAGLSPESSSAMLEKLLKSILVESIGNTPKVEETLSNIMIFINNPGKLTFTFAPQKPISLHELAALRGDEPFITVVATPGPKTLKESMPKKETPAKP